MATPNLPQKTDGRNGQVTARIFWLVIIAVGIIALGSFALSYNALLALAIDNGVPVRLAWIWPLIVDVSVVVFTAAILVSQLQKRGAKLAIGLTIFYGVVTITGNLLHAMTTALGWFVSALPPLSLIFATEMLRAMAHHTIQQQSVLTTLQDLEQQAAQKTQELAALGQQVEAKQKQLSAVNAELLQAKSDKNVDFAESMQQSKQRAITERRQQVLVLLQEGYADKDIAVQLERDIRTIRSDIRVLNGQVSQ